MNHELELFDREPNPELFTRNGVLLAALQEIDKLVGKGIAVNATTTNRIRAILYAALDKGPPRGPACG